MIVIKAHWKQLQLPDKEICKVHLNLSQIQHEAESLQQLSYAKNRIKKSALRSIETFHFVSKKTSSESNHCPKQEFYANCQCENESTKQALYSYMQSNIPPDSFLKTGFTWLSVKKHIHFITSCALFAYQCRHEPEYIAGPLFSSTCSNLCSQPSCTLSLAKTPNVPAHQSEGSRNSYGYDSFGFFVS